MSVCHELFLLVGGVAVLLRLGILRVWDWWASKSSVQSRLRRADRDLHGEFESTRRAMNDAAGQSWRNLTD